MSQNMSGAPSHEDLELQAVRSDVVKELTKSVTAAHSNNNNVVNDDLRSSLQHHLIVLKVEDSDNEASGGEEVASSSTDPRTDLRSILGHNVALRMTPSVSHVVEFAKRLPGFCSLPQDDQLILLKLGFIEVWITRMARLATAECIVFDDGTAITRAQLEVLYDPQFALCLLTYMRNIVKLQMTEEETALYTASLLLCPYRRLLTDVDRITSLHHALEDAMRSSMVKSGVIDIGARMEAIVAAKGDVRALGHRHYMLLNWCRNRWPRLILPALFSEMFDIPKQEDDLIDPNLVVATMPLHG